MGKRKELLENRRELSAETEDTVKTDLGDLTCKLCKVIYPRGPMNSRNTLYGFILQSANRAR